MATAVLMFPACGLAASWTIRVVGHAADSPAANAVKPCKAVAIEVEPICNGVPHCSATRRIPGEVALNDNVRVDLDTSAVSWRAKVLNDNCWSPGAVIQTGASPQSVSLDVWPSLNLSGRLQLADGTLAPKSLSIQLQSPRGSPGAGGAAGPISKVTQTCEVSNRSWRCVTPAITIDVRLEAVGFVPLYLWESRPLLNSRALGDWKLIRGASVSGWIAPAGRRPLVSPVVELEPEAFRLPPTPADGSPLPQIDVTKPTARGFFQVGPVKAGMYVLTTKAKGLSAQRVIGLKITELKEYALPQPLVLESLAWLQIVLSPPTTPSGGFWTIRLEKPVPDTNFRSRVAEQTASPAGELLFSDLDIGKYEVVVLDDGGSRQATKSVKVDGKGPAIAIDLSLVSIDGEITLGSSPLKADLAFDSHDGSKVTMHADERGQFSGSLPREGRWWVEIRPDTPGSGKLLRTISIKRAFGAESAKVKIEITGGRLDGAVVDEKGRSVKAAVQVFRDNALFCHMLTDDDGKFHVLGLEEGSILLRAGGYGKKGYIEHDVRSSLERVEIVVRQQSELKGRVVSSGQRIAGALIRYRGAHLGLSGEIVTGSSGTFLISDLEADQAIDLVVLAPGYPIRVLRFSPWPDEESVRIDVGGLGGFAILEMPKSRRVPFIAGPGSPLSLFSFLRPWEGDSTPEYDPQTSTLAIPLEAGRYALCPDAALNAACRVFLVTPGVQVRVPSIFGEHSDVSESH